MTQEKIYVRLPGQLEPFQTPFDVSGEPSFSCKFIYQTNRNSGRYSGMLPMNFNIGWELANYFPMGYSQQWIFEKIKCFHPDANEMKNGINDDRRNPEVVYPAEEKLSRLQWVNNIYIIFREPVGEKFKNDVIAAELTKETAFNQAETYTKKYGRRSVVGFMIFDYAWH
jgi:hypothetical protein